ncbi:hypothetical protein VTK26DRAFT_2914 [Humicola hyalothermophila]
MARQDTVLDATVFINGMRALSTLVSSEHSLKLAMEVASENANLHAEVKRLDEENASVLNTNGQLNRKLESTGKLLKQREDELKLATKDKERLSADLAEARREAKENERKAGELENSYRKRHEEIEKKLDMAEKELNMIESFLTDLTTVSPSGPVKADDITTILNNIYVFAREIADTYFAQDMPDDILSSDSTWNKPNLLNGLNIPLPMSNSQVAKQMRACAVLFVLGRELCDHIFQPTYLKDAPGLHEALDKLAKENPEHEAFLRSALLTLGGAPDLDAIVNRVDSSLSTLLPSAKRNDLRRELNILFTQAHEAWAFLQLLKERIAPEPGLDLESKYKYRWKTLTFTKPTGASSSSSTQKARPNGTTPAGPSKPQSHHPDTTTTTATLTKGIAIWPAFYTKTFSPFTSSAHPDPGSTTTTDPTILPGLILPPELVDTAQAEQEALARKKVLSEQQKQALATSGGTGTGTANGNSSSNNNNSPHPHRDSRKQRRASMNTAAALMAAASTKYGKGNGKGNGVVNGGAGGSAHGHGSGGGGLKDV